MNRAGQKMLGGASVRRMSADADSWGELASTWDHRDDVIAFADRAYASLLERTGSLLRTPGLRALDFGAGSGLLTERLAPLCAAIVAVDTSPRMLEVLDRKGLVGVQSLCVDLSAGAASTEAALRQPFDLVVASSVLAFVDDYPATLRTLGALLVPGGRLVQWDWELGEEASPADMGLRPSALREAYSAAGLVVEFVGRAFEMEMGSARNPVVIGVARRP